MGVVLRIIDISNKYSQGSMSSTIALVLTFWPVIMRGEAL